MVVNTEQQYMAFAVTLLKKNYTKKAEFGERMKSETQT
jgi:hypothetical protein